MRKVRLEEVKPLAEYERAREAARSRIIALKQRRRVQVGDRISLLFENRDTVLFQIQEMIRAERILALDKVQEEVEVYNTLIPGAGEVSATLFIEIEEQARVKEELDRLMGIDEPGRVAFRLGEAGVAPGVFEAGHSKEDKISAVHFVRFRFAPPQVAALRDPATEVRLVVDHPNYRAEAKVEAALREELLADLADA
ncbi:MAG: DUF3501 family protein [Deltaproteobacteria bacterium]|nr:DUF3501 family protein [Deltaproteobacteria bacterium]